MSKQRVIPLRAVSPAAGNDGLRPHLKAMPPLSLYVHWPWCVRKCPYCDFNSHESRQSIPEATYIDALVADLESALKILQTILFLCSTKYFVHPASNVERKV